MSDTPIYDSTVVEGPDGSEVTHVEIEAIRDRPKWSIESVNQAAGDEAEDK